jgi:hypothetical protein
METLASLVVAMIAGGVIVIGATVTGNQKELCDRMGGKYTPQAAPGDICPGGKWSALVGVRPTPSK